MASGEIPRKQRSQPCIAIDMQYIGLEIVISTSYLRMSLAVEPTSPGRATSAAENKMTRFCTASDAPGC
jgi:hypothetical protein